jgi:hypothetical protein
MKKVDDEQTDTFNPKRMVAGEGGEKTLARLQLEKKGWSSRRNFFSLPFHPDHGGWKKKRRRIPFTPSAKK